MAEMDEVCRECPVQKTTGGPICSPRDIHECPDHREWEGYSRGLIEGEARKAAEAEAVVISDAADLWRVTNAITDAIKARDWVMDGRGQYLWDDERYRQETRQAFEEVLKLIEGVQHPAQRRFREFMEGGVFQHVLDTTRREGRADTFDEIVKWLDNEMLDGCLDAGTVELLRVRLGNIAEDERDALVRKPGVVYLSVKDDDPRWPKDASGQPIR